MFVMNLNIAFAYITSMLNSISFTSMLNDSVFISLLTEIISILVAGISELAAGIGAGLSELVTSIFLSGTGTTDDPYTLSIYGGIIIIFAAISLAIGLSRLVVSWLQSFGN